jgi:hypothetical protein
LLLRAYEEAKEPGGLTTFWDSAAIRNVWAEAQTYPEAKTEARAKSRFPAGMTHKQKSNSSSRFPFDFALKNEKSRKGVRLSGHPLLLRFGDS